MFLSSSTFTGPAQELVAKHHPVLRRVGPHDVRAHLTRPVEDPGGAVPRSSKAAAAVDRAQPDVEGRHAETYEAGDAYLAPPGHLPLRFAGTELVELTVRSAADPRAVTGCAGP